MSPRRFILAPLAALSLALAVFCSATSRSAPEAPAHRAPTDARSLFEELYGRWDIRVDDPSGAYPSWLEVRRIDATLNPLDRRQAIARFVGRAGNARRVTEIGVEGDHVHFEIPPQFESRTEPLKFDGTLQDETMSGETTNDQGERVTWSAVRAPEFERRQAPRWGRSTTLIAPNGLSGWKARGRGDAVCWKSEDGTLSTSEPCVDLVTVRTYRDFKLSLEFMVPPGSDSGVHLRGRYEIQLKDDVSGDEDVYGLTGGVYGFLAPLKPAARKPGEWQTLEATLIGRTLTVVLNGKTVIDAQEIPGITGDALDSDESAAGPIMLQGYLGPVSYRNIVITPALYDL
jgi:hypothetical protein